MKYDDKQFTRAVASGNEKAQNAALKWFCQRSGIRDMATQFLARQGASATDAEEIFQEALIVLFKNIKEGKFREESSVSTYFISICKHMHRKSSKKKHHREISVEESRFPDEEMPSREEWIMKQEIRKEISALVGQLIGKLGGKCQTALQLYMLSYPMERIATDLNYANTQSAKDRVRRCREQLRGLVLENPRAMQIVNLVL
ncbi:MAG: sigma-70 family RNA polymerase sigma factor [Phaeodactylibacter sp.]|nr:sigma-70 family RNA polymerase sigma factor [Phaeodactylibacter sp.]MCB9293707.1 sigma-70 family RNA polymerase sigma factor [Lewinellaceae bacterium]